MTEKTFLICMAVFVIAIMLYDRSVNKQQGR